MNGMMPYPDWIIDEERRQRRLIQLLVWHDFLLALDQGGRVWVLNAPPGDLWGGGWTCLPGWREGDAA